MVDLMALAEGNDEPKLSRGLSDLRGTSISKDLLSKFNAAPADNSYEAIPKPKSPARKWTPPTSPPAVATGGAKPPPSSLKITVGPPPDVTSGSKVDEPMSPQSPLSENPFLQKDKSRASMSDAVEKSEAGSGRPAVDEELEGAAARIRAARNSFAASAESEKSPSSSSRKASERGGSSSQQPAEEEDEEAAVAARVRAARNSFSEREKQVEKDPREVVQAERKQREKPAAAAASAAPVKLEEVALADPTAAAPPSTAAETQPEPEDAVPKVPPEEVQAEVSPQVEAQVEAKRSAASGGAAQPPDAPPAAPPATGSCCIIA